MIQVGLNPNLLSTSPGKPHQRRLKRACYSLIWKKRYEFPSPLGGKIIINYAYTVNYITPMRY